MIKNGAAKYVKSKSFLKHKSTLAPRTFKNKSSTTNNMISHSTLKSLNNPSEKPKKNDGINPSKPKPATTHELKIRADSTSPEEKSYAPPCIYPPETHAHFFLCSFILKNLACPVVAHLHPSQFR